MPNLLIIGGGYSGLISCVVGLKHNFKVTLIEQREKPGGIWNSKKSWEEEWITRYDNMQTNTPSSWLQVPGFPKISKSAFPSPDEFLSYIDMMFNWCKESEKFSYRFDSRVASIKYNSKDKPCWEVMVETKQSQHHLSFDCIMVASGFYSKPNIPNELFAIMRNYKGNIIHSSNYKNKDPFINKAVEFIGVNTSSDIAIYIANDIESLTFRTRRINEGDSCYGFPIDFDIASVLVHLRGDRENAVKSIITKTTKINFWRKAILKINLIKLFFVNAIWLYPAVRPFDVNKDIFWRDHNEKPFDKVPFCSFRKELIPHIVSGKVKYKPMFVDCYENGVINKNLEKQHADYIICGTGYLTSVPFVDSLFDSKFWYKEIQNFCLHPFYPTLGFIGLHSPWFSIGHEYSYCQALYFVNSLLNPKLKYNKFIKSDHKEFLSKNNLLSLCNYQSSYFNCRFDNKGTFVSEKVACFHSLLDCHLAIKLQFEAFKDCTMYEETLLFRPKYYSDWVFMYLLFMPSLLLNI